MDGVKQYQEYEERLYEAYHNVSHRDTDGLDTGIPVETYFNADKNTFWKVGDPYVIDYVFKDGTCRTDVIETRRTGQVQQYPQLQGEENAEENEEQEEDD